MLLIGTGFKKIHFAQWRPKFPPQLHIEATLKPGCAPNRTVCSALPSSNLSLSASLVNTSLVLLTPSEDPTSLQNCKNVFVV